MPHVLASTDIALKKSNTDSAFEVKYSNVRTIEKHIWKVVLLLNLKSRKGDKDQQSALLHNMKEVSPYDEFCAEVRLLVRSMVQGPWS